MRTGFLLLKKISSFLFLLHYFTDMEIIFGILLLALAAGAARKGEYLASAVIAFLGLWLAAPGLLHSGANIIGWIAVCGVCLWGLRKMVSGRS